MTKPEPGIEPGGALIVSAALVLWLLIKFSRAFVRFHDRNNLDYTTQEYKRMSANESRPRPLRTIASIVGGLTALVSGLVGSGLLTADQGGAITGVINAVVVLLGTLGLVLTAERKVTPLADPRDSTGRALVPSEREGNAW